MSQLNGLGVISYNGYELRGPRNSIQLEMQNVRDQTGRYVTHTVFRFSVDAWITADEAGTQGDGTDASVHSAKLRAALGEDGGILQISGIGYGDITANTSADDRDVNFGPKVTMCKMRNIGNGCIVVMWSVDVALKICGQGAATGSLGRLKEYVYAARWTIRPNGCTVRTVEGHIEIFNNIASPGSLEVVTTADDLRDLIFIPLPTGFYRSQPQEYWLSENKQRLQFRVVDEEPVSDNAFPDGVVAIQMDHNVTSDLFGEGGGFRNHTSTISGSIEMARPYNSALAWSRAVLLIQERLVHAVNVNNLAPMLTKVSVTESIFERRVQFSVQYRLLGSNLQALIDGSGLFTAVQSTTMAAYRQSMQLAWGNRGTARLQHDATSDKMVDQCSENAQVRIQDKIAPYFLDGSTGAIFLVCPPEDKSYLLFENVIDINADNPGITLTRMGTSQSQSTSETISAFGPKFISPRITGDGGQTIQSTGAPKLQVTVRGRAYRVGYYPEVLPLISIFGQKAYLNQRLSNQSMTQVGKYGDCPIWATNWSYVYSIPVNADTDIQELLKLGTESAVYGPNPNDKISKM